jgi:ferredoxin
MPPPLPGYSLPQVLVVRDRIVDRSQIHVGTVLLGDYYEDWLALAHSAVPDIPLNTLRLSSRSLLDRELTLEKLGEFAWRMAGNLKTLRAGQPVTAWGMQAIEEWMPLYVGRARPGRNRRDEAGHWLTFRVMAGSACPLEVRRFWTWPMASFVSDRLGFNPRANRPFPGADHFVGMLLYGLFEPQLSEDRPGFHQVRVSAVMLAHNVNLIKGRNEKPCPTFGYLHDCAGCTIGYDRCPYAVHAQTFIRQHCITCGRADALFDPDQPEHCLDCLQVPQAKDES